MEDLMGRSLFNIFMRFCFCTLFISACTGSNNNSGDEVLNSEVFSEAQTSYQNSSVQAFDGQNRPILSSTKESCNEDPTVPPTCETGFQYDEAKKACVPICNENQVFAQGQCFDKEVTCDLENGSGTQTWLANSYGECVPNNCNDGYQVENNQCSPICGEDEVYHNGQCKPIIADCEDNGKKGSKVWLDAGYGKCHTSENCNMPDGKGLKRWNPQTLLYDNCEVVSCDKGFKKHENSCVSVCKDDEVYNGKKCLPIVKECTIAGGKGQKTWVGKLFRKYSRCEVVSCNEGFEKRGNSCVRPTPPGRECDPLVVDLGADINNARGITLSSQEDGILFDILGLNSTPNPHDKKQISWTQQSRYQYVVLPDSNGRVTGIQQMFGDNTLGPDGKFSAEGFEALSKYDIDRNGSIDPDDPVFFQLALWHDANGNGQSDLGELTSFMDAGISSISLNFDPNFYEVDQYGNKTTYKSVVHFNNGKRTLIFDLWFKYFEPDNGDDGGDQCPSE